MWANYEGAAEISRVIWTQNGSLFVSRVCGVDVIEKWFVNQQ